MSDDVTSGRPQREDYERAVQSMGTFIDASLDDLMVIAERAQHFAALRRTESLQVSRIMSRPVRTVQPQTTMADAAHLMVSERISGLPVVDDDGHLVGIITEADFLRGLGVPAHHPTHNVWQTLEALFGHLARNSALEGPRDPVASHMVHDVVCASPDDHIDDVIALMKQHRVKRILVCGEGRRVEGMVTRSDLVRIFFDRYVQADKSAQRDSQDG